MELTGTRPNQLALGKRVVKELIASIPCSTFAHRQATGLLVLSMVFTKESKQQGPHTTLWGVVLLPGGSQVCVSNGGFAPPGEVCKHNERQGLSLIKI